MNHHDTEKQPDEFAMIAPEIQKMRARVTDFLEKESPLTAQEGEERIDVDEISSQLSHFYERIRYSVDYKEEHLLRRNAIKRMLKRRLQEQFRRGKIAPFLVVELVRSGYLKNSTLPERIIKDVDAIVQKSVLLYQSLPGSDQEIFGSSDNFDRIMGMAAMEIESYLFPDSISMICLDTMYLSLQDSVEIKGSDLSDDDHNAQLYIACARSFLGYTESELFYVLWSMYHPTWIGSGEESDIQDIAEHFDTYRDHILEQIKAPLNWRIVPKLRNSSIYFALIRESITDKPELWTGKQLDLTLIKKHIDALLTRKYDAEKNHIAKSVNRAIIYILLTKTVLAFLIELPYDMWHAGKVNRVALFINIFFHPALLFVSTRVVRLPRSGSRQSTVEGIVAIIKKQKRPAIIVWAERKKSLFGYILSILYIFFFVLIFACFVWALQKLNFNIVSGGLFMFFLSLVAYLALRIRGRAKRWRITPKTHSAKSFLVDLLTLPIVQSGQWFIKRFEHVNIFVFILDFLIETPFKVLIDVFEGFTHYLREKKERLE